MERIAEIGASIVIKGDLTADENVVIAGIQCAMILAHNRIVDQLTAQGVPVTQRFAADIGLPSAGEPAWSTEALAEMMAALGFPVAQMTEEDRQGLGRFADVFVTEVFSGPLLAAVADRTPLSRITLAVPAARRIVTEILGALGRGLPPLNEDVSDVLAVFVALMLIRIEELGGDEAMAELADRARIPAAAPRWSSAVADGCRDHCDPALSSVISCRHL